MKIQRMDRRGFLKYAATGALGMLAIAQAAQRQQGQKPGKKGSRKLPVAVQLWSVRHEAAKDLPATLRLIKAMGYDGVEFAGFYGWKAKQIAAMLKDIGLQCCGTHTPLEDLLGDRLPQTVEFNQTIGNRNIVVPSLPGRYQSSADGWKRAADLFSELADKLKEYGMRLGYHNHMAEFRPLNGSTGWDLFFSRVSKDVFMQLDTGNAAAGGADPLAVLKRYPGRVRTLHAKPYSKKKPGAVIGEDDLPWKQILDWCITKGGTEWIIVEYEEKAHPELEGVYLCLKGLCKLGYC